MFGLGIVRGLGVTLKHFFESYIEDLRWVGRKYTRADILPVRQGAKAKGIFTVQYPEEKLPIPEQFRFIPFLLYEDETGHDRCTSCGICAKVCPPQCIWIVRGTDPRTGRPKPEPEEFYIDIDICMNCGYCAEYCPFDAIKMDHDFELATYDRTTTNIFDLEKLRKPVSYYAGIRPTDYAREEAVRADKDGGKKKPAAERPAAPARTPAAPGSGYQTAETPAAVAAAPATHVEPAQSSPAAVQAQNTGRGLSPEEIARRKAEQEERRRAREAAKRGGA
jgi:NADH-quinone oxidoreductase subunit I